MEMRNPVSGEDDQMSSKPNSLLKMLINKIKLKSSDGTRKNTFLHES